MQTKKFSLLLKIRHPDADPGVFTRMLNIEPECSWKAGEAKNGKNPNATHRETCWLAEVPSRIKDSERSQRVYPEPPGMLMLTALLFERRKHWWAGLQAEGATAQVILVIGRDSITGFDLPLDILSLLSKYGLSVYVDIRDAVDKAA